MQSVGRSGQARCFLVPAELRSVSKTPNHWVITHPTTTTTSSAPTTESKRNEFKVRAEWVNRGSTLAIGASGLYSMARCMLEQTSRTGSYTMCFSIQTPDDRAPSSSSVTTSSSSSRPALLHIIERVEDDYNPNNMIYHRIRERNDEFFFSIMIEEKATTTAAAVEKGSTVDGGGDLSVGEKQRQLMAMQKDLDLEQEQLAHATGDGDEECDDVCEDEDDDGSIFVPTPEQQEAEKLNLSATLPTLKEGDKIGETEKEEDARFYFWPHKNSTRTIAWMSRNFMVLVNLKPAVEGHCLVVPKRVVPCIQDLTPMELIEWAEVVKLTQQVLWRAYVAREHEEKPIIDEQALVGPDFSIAIQQGKLSMQTVPHLHTHVIVFKPTGRLAGEPEEGDEEAWSKVKARTVDEMAAEASLLRKYFEKEVVLA